MFDQIVLSRSEADRDAHHVSRHPSARLLANGHLNRQILQFEDIKVK